MPMSPNAMMEAIERNLPVKTGRTLAQWAALVRREGPKERKERVAWLREEHGLGGATATLVAHASGSASSEPSSPARPTGWTSASSCPG
jgi:hypothetical protein